VRTRVLVAVLALMGPAVLVSCRGDSITRLPTTARHKPTPIAEPARPDDPRTDIYAATAPGMFSPAVKDVPTRVYVPNSESNSVDVIDPATFKVVDHFDVGHQPQHVTPSWDLRMLYADNDLGDTLTPIDPRTGTRAGPDLPVLDPYNLYFTLDGTRAIVVAERFRRLEFRDPKTWQVVGTVPIPHRGVDHMDFSADGRYVIASCEFSGWIVKVDVASMQMVGELEVKGQPIDVKLSPDGKIFYVANQSRDGVSLIDGETMKELEFVHTGKGAHGLYVSRDGRFLYVTNRGEGTVSVISFATKKVIADWKTGGSPDMGGVTSDGKQLWLSGRYNAEVYVIDTHDGSLLAKIPVGRGPHGLSIFPQPGRYSLGHTGIFR
jgi:YVTN family beta-propeller protein